jgi:hypothetical protein
MKHVLSTVECVRGLYPVTLKFLDLLSTLVNKLQGWHHYGGGARVRHPFSDRSEYFLLMLWLGEPR